MQCPSCQAENPRQANFCNACGTEIRGRLAIASASERVPRDYTPRHLAERIITMRSSVEGERKTVTALFADIQGSMDLSEQVDPETWHDVLDRFFRILSEGIHRYDGTVNQYTGDGIMALFGAPIAHEDHAVRACHAAVDLLAELSRYAADLKRRYGLRFSVRMGINSGDVVVGRIGDDLRMDYTAQGHSVGLAARMEKLASPNAAYLSENTARLVEGYFSLRDLGHFELKGVAVPVCVYELLGRGPVRTRLEWARTRGLTPFTHRRDEVASLEAALAKARAGNGQVVCIEGEAGVGKSRLAYEFSERCRREDLVVIETHCPAHGPKSPLLPLRGLLAATFGIEAGDPDELVREKLAGRLLRLEPALADALPAAFEVLGVPDRGAPGDAPMEARRRQIVDVLLHGLSGETSDDASVVLFEDLQWADEGTEAVLAAVARQITDRRSLWIVNFRPEYRPPFGDLENVTWITLPPLGAPGVGAMLDDLVGDAPELAAVRRTIETRSGGNPFFVEELVHALIEDGSLEGEAGAYLPRGPIPESALPSSVRTLLASRIDRLSEAEKELVQTAAVIGRSFEEPLLRAVARVPSEQVTALLERLERSNLLVVEEREPTLRYAFRHPLTFEVASGALLVSARTRIHEAVARCLESQAGDRADRHAAVLAHHYQQAGDELSAARWHLRAAVSASQLDVPASLAHYDRVRELAAGLSTEPEADRLRLQACLGALEVSGRLGLSLEQASDLFEEGVEIAERSSDAGALARLHSGLAARHIWSGDPVKQRRHLAEATRIAKELPDLEVNLTVLHRAYVAEFHAGALPAALAHAQQGVERAERESGAQGSPETQRLHRTLLISSANVLTQMGHLKEAEVLLARTASLAERSGATTGHTQALVSANLSNYRGRRVESLRNAQALISLAARTGSTWADPVAHATLGRALLTNGDFRGAREAFEHALDRARELQLGLESEALYVAGLAQACAGCGELDRAGRLAVEAVAVAERMGTRFWAVEARIGRARVLLGVDRPEDRTAIAESLDIATELIDDTGGEVLRPVVLELRAEQASRAGDESLARRLLAQARAAYDSIGADGHVERL